MYAYNLKTIGRDLYEGWGQLQGQTTKLPNFLTNNMIHTCMSTFLPGKELLLAITLILPGRTCLFPLIQDGALSVRWADEASIMYERATGGLLRNSLLMHFAHADFEEVTTEYDNCTIVTPNINIIV